MYPWDLLGIEPTDDVRAIKRAYARLLQVHRPDEDQEAFERLRQAYERALASVPTRERPALPTLDLTPPGPNARLPELLSAQFQAYPPPTSEPLPPLEPVPPSAPLPPEPEPEPGPLPPELLALENPPPELGPLLKREARRRRKLVERAEQAAALPEIPLHVPRPPAVIAGEIMQLCWRHPHDPAKLQAYFAEQPDLFNIETKSAVSLELARTLVGDQLLPPALQPLLVHFFEWDTFTEQRRLSAVLKKPEKLRFIVTAAEMQQYLDSTPKAGGKRDLNRRSLRLIRAAGTDWRAWALVLLYPWRDKRVGTALADADRRFGSAALDFVVGARTVRFWRDILGTKPNLIQGGVRFSRFLALNLVTTLPALILLWALGKDNPFALMAVVLATLAYLISMVYFGRWALRAGFYALNMFVLRRLLRATDALGILRYQRLFAVWLVFVTLAEFFWPRGWSGWYLAAILTTTLLLTITDVSALLGIIVTVLATFVMLAAREPAHLHWYVTGWLLACIYIQWLGFWGERWQKRRDPQSKVTAAGASFAFSGVFLIAAIVFLNVTKH
jgi:hypothetical protein